ncbi:PIG-L family deacetylase, partial [Staphylococcus sp. SIMBA_130]
RFIFIFAHTDDESFTCGGTLIELAKAKDTKTILYSATPGDAGKCGEPPLCQVDELAEVRKKELEKASKLLGIDELYIGDYQDGKLNNLPDDELKNDVLKRIEAVQPD